MKTRLQLQSKLEEMLGSRNVYYQLPETIKMGYPAIVYYKNTFDTTHADDLGYIRFKQYNVIVISKKPDEEIINKLLEEKYCRHDRHYISDGLHHDVFTLYY